MSEQYQNYVTKKSFYIVCAIAAALLLALVFSMRSANKSDDLTILAQDIAQEIEKQNPTKIILQTTKTRAIVNNCTQFVNGAGVLVFTYHNSGPNRWRRPCHTPHR